MKRAEKTLDWDDEAEGFSLGSLGNQLQAAMPGAIQGGLTGFAVGGPMGAAVGAGAGGVLGATAPRPKPAPRPPSVPGAAMAPAGGSTAAMQLLQTLANPQVMGAVQALASGQTPGAGASVPPGAIMNLLGVLASQAATEAEDLGWSSDDAYLRDARGTYVCDPLDARSRAVRVRHLLDEAPTASETADSGAQWLARTGLLRW